MLCFQNATMTDQSATTAKRARFEAEALPHLDALYAMAMRLSHNPHDADDLLQETWLRAYRFFDNFAAGTNCRAWLLTILFNNFRNGYRKTAREQPSSSPADFDRMAETRSTADAESVRDPEHLIAGRSLEHEIDSALAALPQDFRDPILLVDVEELSYQEVSTVLNVPVGTVKSRVSRGRALMRSALKEYARDRGLLGQR